MILVDTSVWVGHLRTGDPHLRDLLESGEVACHPFVIGELACGNLSRRAEILGLLQDLPWVPCIEQEEFLPFVDTHHLAGAGIGFVDVHLLAAAKLAGVPLWTLDRNLRAVAGRMAVGYR